MYDLILRAFGLKPWQVVVPAAVHGSHEYYKVTATMEPGTSLLVTLQATKEQPGTFRSTRR